MTENKDEALQLIRKCVDYKGYGDLYILNKEISKEDCEKVKQYFHKFRLEDYDDVMQIEGDPVGWMVTKEKAPLVERELGIIETLEIRKMREDAEKEKLAKSRKQKDEAMIKIEELFYSAKRPKAMLDDLLQKAIVTYDPGNYYKRDKEIGGGQLYIVTKDSIWYIINNGGKDHDWSLNNVVVIGHGGAMGFKLPYTEDLHELVKIASDENEYYPE